MISFKPILFALATLLPVSLAAQEYDTRVLMTRGQWRVEVTYSPSNDAYWCVAGTENNSQQKFNLVAYDNNALALFVFDPVWNLEARPIRFLVDIDRSRWTIDGTGEGVGISLNMTDPDKAVDFLVQLKRGNRVTVYNEQQRRLANFSLSGSSAAIASLFDCWERITTGTDPF